MTIVCILMHNVKIPYAIKRGINLHAIFTIIIISIAYARQSKVYK